MHKIQNRHSIIAVLTTLLTIMTATTIQKHPTTTNTSTAVAFPFTARNTFLHPTRRRRQEEEEEKENVDLTTTTTAKMSIGDCKLGPKVKEDDDECLGSSSNVTKPENLQYCIEFNLPVGYRRLRFAFLNKQSPFWLETILKGALRYKNVTLTEWDHYNKFIGSKPKSSKSPFHKTINESEFIGAKKTTHYQMPKTKLVKESQALETAEITQYDDVYTVLKIQTSTPDVPFGNRFVAQTQFVLMNTGKNSCKLICSVQTEFPNGEPLGMGRHIRKGMKKGSMDTFVKIKDAVMALCV